MPQEIYNEGRVVGLSAWELFMREALSHGVPPEEIPDEHKWLVSMLGSGSSMILRIPAGTTKGVHDYPLPSNSNLSAAGVIVANPFIGQCEWDSSTWATKVISYSPLILNTPQTHPSSSNVPYDPNYSITEYSNNLAEFVKLVDGIVYTDNATWIQNDVGLPDKDIDPNFNESSTVVRLYMNADIKYDTAILLTGFLNKRILQIAGFATDSVGGSTDVDHNNWPDGGMLGPEIIPWASKIVFSVPSASYNLLTQLTRTIPSDTSYTIPEGGLVIDNFTIKENAIGGQVRTNPIVDFESINLTDYYTNKQFHKSPTIQESVSELNLGINNASDTLTAWYPGLTANDLNSAGISGSSFFPPALYAAQVTQNGSQTLVPLDTAAPGTVKGFETPEQAIAYKHILPDNHAIYYNSTLKSYSFVIANESSANWPSTAKLEYLGGDYPKVSLTASNKTVQLVSLTASDNTQYDVTGGSGTTAVGPVNNLTWANMLTSLKQSKQMDVLGPGLHRVGTELDATNTIGITNTINNIGGNTVTITGTNPVSIGTSVTNGTNLATLLNNTSIKSGTNFIEFSNGLRLYISGDNPGTTNVPVGSIGIGW